MNDSDAAATAGRLLDDELHFGWGVRAGLSHRDGLATRQLAIAAGLARYGHHEAAGTVASATLATAPYFENRLPELTTMLELQPGRTDVAADLPDPIGHVAIQRQPNPRPQSPPTATV